MADKEIYVEAGPAGIAKLGKRLIDARKLLKQIGIMLVKDSRQAFQEQKFGGVIWPKKYPNQTRPPFISIAGVVQDFGEGMTKPRSETLQEKPALHRTGALRNSPAAHPMGEDSIEIGSVLPYATLMQRGGDSDQPVTEDIKNRIETWLGVSKKKEIFSLDYEAAKDEARARGQGFVKLKKQPKKGGGPNMVKVEVRENEQYRKKLAFLLRPKTDTLTTTVNARPFIGIKAETADKLSELIQDYISKPFEGRESVG